VLDSQKKELAKEIRESEEYSEYKQMKEHIKENAELKEKLKVILCVGEKKANDYKKSIKKQIEEGRQAYIVCPLVEENEEINAKSVMEMVEIYKNQVFTEFRVEYMYGKMKQKEKDFIMDEFKNGNIDILISTTVIEVGVNVPNSNIMIIENADWSYDFKYDTSKTLEEQSISEEAKTVLAIIYMRYFANEEEKLDLINKIRQNDELEENQKNEKYNPDKIFDNVPKNITELENEINLVNINEKWYQRIFNKIKFFFKK